MSEVFSHVEVSKSRSNGVVVGTEIRLWSLHQDTEPYSNHQGRDVQPINEALIKP